MIPFNVKKHSDLVITVQGEVAGDERTFHLHKFPLISKSVRTSSCPGVGAHHGCAARSAGVRLRLRASSGDGRAVPWRGRSRRGVVGDWRCWLLAVCDAARPHTHTGGAFGTP